jgi:general secretion pathway protein M
MRPLSRREARLIALLILVALIALLDLMVVAPIVSGFTDRAEQRELLLARYSANDRTIAAIPRLRRRAEAQGHALARFTLAAADSAGAAQNLRDRLQNAVTAIGGDFRGSADAPAAPGWASAHVDARLTQPQLAALLTNLENSPPFLIVNSLSVSADDALVTGTASTLDVQIEASVPVHLSAAR